MKKHISNQKGLWVNPRSKNLWFRRVVPNNIRDNVGKTMIKFSLLTSDIRHAEVLAQQWWEQTERDFAQFRSGGTPVSPENKFEKPRFATNEDLIRIAKWWREIFLKTSRNIGEFNVTDENTREDILALVARNLSAAGEWASTDDYGYMIHIARDVLKDQKPPLEADDETIKLLAKMLVDVEVGVTEYQVAPFSGQFPDVDRLNRDPAKVIIKNKNITQLLEDYFQDRRPPSQTEAEWRLYFKRLTDVIKDKPIVEVEKADIRNFRQTMEKFPSRLPLNLRQRSVAELVAHAAKNNLQILSSETVRKHINAVSSVFSWAVKADLILYNPASGQGPKKQVRDKPIYPFNEEHLKRLFNLELYYRYAKREIDFWVPLICLYSGARREEIVQLHLSDVVCDKNIWSFQIRPKKGDGAKSVKVQVSVRQVPIHQSLIDVGFLVFFEERRMSGDEILFTDTKRSTHGRLATQFGKRFAYYMRTKVGITSPRYVFYSFRHTFKDATREAGISRENSDRLTGHSDQSVSGMYGTGPSIALLAKEINKIFYPTVPNFSWKEYQRRSPTR